MSLEILHGVRFGGPDAPDVVNVRGADPALDAMVEALRATERAYDLYRDRPGHDGCAARMLFDAVLGVHAAIEHALPAGHGMRAVWDDGRVAYRTDLDRGLVGREHQPEGRP